MTECVCRHCRCVYNILPQCLLIRFYAVPISSGSAEANLKGEGAETSGTLGAENPKMDTEKALLGVQGGKIPLSFTILTMSKTQSQLSHLCYLGF